ncbi:MAG: group III truncated hemoglobin [Gammaproteobacteria bacterium]|jgi:hemoglobin|nr:group III truncated hemoglobin [Zhongshania sp.]MBU0538948.1 group III truncated hemoglobin [Gammaproteobacteria bacterium]MBU1832388.1 group III truncated hemoglobin [Gammaproteobacteria bacterium]
MCSSVLKNNKPDLDSPEHIAVFVEAFYACLLKDERLAPIFIDVADIDIQEHFPRIQAYWEKLLLGENNYHRHTMNIHRQLDAKHRLSDSDFEQWLGYFIQTANRYFTGEKTERAKRIAATIAENMRNALNASN